MRGGRRVGGIGGRGFDTFGPSLGAGSRLGKGRGTAASGEPPAWATAKAAEMSDEGRLGLRIAGFVLLGLGVVLLVVAITGFSASMDSMSTFGPGGPGDGPSMAGVFVPFLLGGLCFSAGGICLKLGYLRTISGVLATETAPATRVAATSLGQGLGAGLRQSGFTMGLHEVVKVRCRNCNELDTEDARFCSNCAEPM